jgi:hypothetical protein
MTILHDVRAPHGFPGQGTIHDRASHAVDASGWVWVLNALPAVRIDFRRLGVSSPNLLLALVRYIAHRVTVASVDDVRNTFDTLIFLQRSEHFRECDANIMPIGLKLISDLRLVEEFAGWRLHYVRAWYRWCAMRDLLQFSGEVADELKTFRFGGNQKGVAVRTRDPLHGALDEVETFALIAKLKEIGPAVLTLFERALIWLALAFGSNPKALALLREEDLTLLSEVGTDRIHYRLRIPRIKKRKPFLRAAFHRKRPHRAIGELIEALVRENVEFRRENGWTDGCAFPLFRRKTPQPDLLGSPLHEFAMHCDSGDLTSALKTAVAKLDVISHRTGKPINVTMMRFRRTFATRAAEENVAPAELATMMDHTDLQHVPVYYETRSSIVERLDAAMAVKLGPLSDAFLGRIVATEAEAYNGDDPAKRIPWFGRQADPSTQRPVNLGTCGAGACAEFAPISCYTCRKFQPWKDGPHREILQQLCDERDRRKAEGLDPQMVGVNDATILAIGEVVAACEGETNQ